MKSRLKQRIFALSLLAWTAVCPADAQQTRSLRDQFLSPSDEAKPWTFWYWMYGAVSKEGITADKIEKIVKLNKIAENRGQSLAQMACAWNLRGGKLTSVLLGASKASQIIENVNSLNNLDFTQDELNAIEDALK